MAVNMSRTNNTNNANYGNNDEVFFSIVSNIGVLAEYQTGWKKEVNLVAWNGNPPKFDVRDWSPDHERMSRGITLHEEEARKLAEHLAKRFRGGPRMAHQSAPSAAATEEAREPAPEMSLDAVDEEAVEEIAEEEFAEGVEVAEAAEEELAEEVAEASEESEEAEEESA